VTAKPWPGVVTAFRHRLPLLAAAAPAVTLLEGDTPLLFAELDGVAVHLKIEGQNPTGSFKDRGMCVAVSGAVAAGARGVLCASTGNTAASAAAYAARAGLSCTLLLPAGGVALGKVAQALGSGARAVSVEGPFDAALALARRLTAERPDLALVNSVNPLRLEGQKTAAFEVVAALGGRAPDALVLPVGNAGNISAYWRGFTEEHAATGAGLPRLFGVQAAGAAPMVTGQWVDEPRTFASAIRIGRPASAHLARRAVEESGGAFLAVTDEEIAAAHRDLPRQTGVFAEPASCAAVAGLRRLLADGAVTPGMTVVLVLTGHGLKDPDAVTRGLALPEPIPATDAALTAALAPA
jgi:threonine synthase